MTTTTYYPPRSMPLPHAAILPATALERLIVFLAGLMLPAVALSPWGSSSSSFIGRVTPVDLVVCFAILTLAVRGRRLQWDAPVLSFFVVMVIAVGKGLAQAQVREEFLIPVTAFVALSMALAYWVLGASIANSRELVRTLIFGAMCGVALEGIIVLHDYLLPGSKWFVDRSDMRVRGTFRKSGQLAAYGFSVMGLLLSFGWLFWKSPATRLFGLITVAFGPLFVLAASRRSGMAAVAIWLAAYLIVGLRHAPRWVYTWLIVLSVAGGLAMAMNWAAFESSYAGQRVLSAVAVVEQGSSFTQRQFDAAIDNFDKWFPLGTGIGMGHTAVGVLETTNGVAAVAEIHNGHLAIIVELGLLGSLAFCWMVWRAMFRRWNDALGPDTRFTRVVVMTFLFAAMVFAIHNRLHRDRGFMLLLGLACHASWSMADGAKSRRGSPRGGLPKGVIPVVLRVR